MPADIWRNPQQTGLSTNFMNEFYSCFVLLQGSGTYITTDGRRLPIEAGDLVQRLPGIRHSTQVNPDGQWLEFFLSFGKSVFENLCKLHIVTEQPVQKACLLESDPADFSNLIKELKSASKEELPEALLKLQSTVLKLYGFGRPAACTSHIRERLPVHVTRTSILPWSRPVSASPEILKLKFLWSQWPKVFT